jgi:hypothetical protein
VIDSARRSPFGAEAVTEGGDPRTPRPKLGGGGRGEARNPSRARKCDSATAERTKAEAPPKSVPVSEPEDAVS